MTSSIMILIPAEIIIRKSPYFTYRVILVSGIISPLTVAGDHQSDSAVLLPLISIMHDMPVLAALATGLLVSIALREA
jgi:hypothetical protein